MFNIGAAELILILLIAFVVVGPKDLPKIARALARFIRYIRGIIREVSRETGMDEIAGEMRSAEKEVREAIRSVDADGSIRETVDELDHSVRNVEKDVNQSVHS